MTDRGYSLLGRDAARATDAGLATADWYHSDVLRKDMKALMAREDGPAIRDTVVLYGAMIAPAAAAVAMWQSWWSAPFFLTYGFTTVRRPNRAGTNAARARPSARPG
jgi:fatty acid desaturase